jgi:hypothetical protein
MCKQFEKVSQKLVNIFLHNFTHKCRKVNFFQTHVKSRSVDYVRRRSHWRFLVILPPRRLKPVQNRGHIAKIRGVLGNKCAGHHNLKTDHFRETLASGNFLAWSSVICIFFCSALSILGRRRQAFM